MYIYRGRYTYVYTHNVYAYVHMHTAIYRER